MKRLAGKDLASACPAAEKRGKSFGVRIDAPTLRPVRLSPSSNGTSKERRPRPLLLPFLRCSGATDRVVPRRMRRRKLRRRALTAERACGEADPRYPGGHWE